MNLLADKTLATRIDIEEIQSACDALRSSGGRLAFVPTMGALHAGHLSLIDVAREAGYDKIVVSIFVNPTQFGPTEDFAAYPRQLEQDLAALQQANIDELFLPNAADMFPDGGQTEVVNTGLSLGLCGASRPGHFSGVQTVVLKLLNIIRPAAIVLGKKDYQQYRVVEQMVEDLNLSVDVIGAPTMREEDGLALSSRNVYLNDEQRQQALAISRGLFAIKEQFAAGERQVQTLKQVLTSGCSEAQLDLEYCEICDQSTLQPLGDVVESGAVVLLAVKVGETRLIDNIELVL